MVGAGRGRRGKLRAPSHTLPPNTTCTWTFHGRPGKYWREASIVSPSTTDLLRKFPQVTWCGSTSQALHTTR